MRRALVLAILLVGAAPTYADEERCNCTCAFNYKKERRVVTELTDVACGQCDSLCAPYIEKAIAEIKRARAAPTPAAAPAKTVPAGTDPAEDIKDVIAKSATFAAISEDLRKKRFSFEYGTAGKGTYVDKISKRIVVDSTHKGEPDRVAGLLAHEFGHTRYPNKTAKLSLPRDEYVKAVAVDNLTDEGEATLVTIAIKRELKAAKGPDVPVPGVKSAEYEKIFDKYPKEADRGRARAEVGKIFGSDENPSTSPSLNYWDYYSGAAGDAWDAAHATTGP